MRYKANPDVVAMGLAVQSLDLVTQNIPFSASEDQGPAGCEGQYIRNNKILTRMVIEIL